MTTILKCLERQELVQSQVVCKLWYHSYVPKSQLSMPVFVNQAALLDIMLREPPKGITDQALSTFRKLGRLSV